MSENRYFSQEGGHGEDAAQNCEHLRNMTTDELIEELAEKWDAMDETDYDTALIDAYLAVLEEKSPITPNFDADASLTAFQEKHARLFEKTEPVRHVRLAANPPMPRRRIRFVQLVAAAIVVMLGCMVVAQALGYNVFGTIARWTEETFHFGAAEQSREGLPSNTVTVGETEYSSLQEALTAYGITEPLAPNWYPEGFEVRAITVTPQLGAIKIRASYQAEEKSFSITIWQYETEENMESGTFEKDATDVTLYERGSITHYIMSNNAHLTATWVNGKILCSISGDLHEDELKQMINSIYDEG
ncbi:hypothetical protein SDC9_51423 [bioreactor metagenome]|uniref:DUF4367 domain-containing protein n=1 Tax=bioreactor metagenome TaxID=1076179 RepID=A0A644WND1_9ZZZZ|nr:DUF4367 domain-containing protein [Pseudoflavonifractor sp.]